MSSKDFVMNVIIMAVCVISLSGTSSMASEPNKAALKLNASVVQQRSCENGDVRLWLQLRYTNVGSDPIILKRFSGIIVRYMTSRDERSAAKRNYEDEVYYNISFSSALNPTTGSSPSEKQFVILKAGESHEIEARSIGFVWLAADQVSRYSKGNHVLQVRVATWTEPLPLAKELSVIWHDYGVLWWQDVTSEPTPFKIEKPTSTGKCSEYDQSQVN